MLHAVSVSGALALLHDEVLSSTGTFDVQGIPGGYKALLGRLAARGSNASAQVDVYARFNNDSGSNYSGQVLTATGVSVASAGGDGTAQMHIGYAPAASATAGFGSYISFEIPDYAGTTLHKGIVAVASTSLASFYFVGGSGKWTNTAAISRVALFPSVGSFIAGSRLTIYGLG